MDKHDQDTMFKLAIFKLAVDKLAIDKLTTGKDALKKLRMDKDALDGKVQDLINTSVLKTLMQLVEKFVEPLADIVVDPKLSNAQFQEKIRAVEAEIAEILVKIDEKE
ncbi:hypothetical protein DM02DRAFT_608226 [Periconia macrospinosa]|uniref:Uncharacterized protein n=1 Tax=Periconia macrospinosa TaxID=97972 RepID=A0A2V1EF97_9PLEO|nr:hypothetical protein DM02DRAFT_608226 [Periconia macrospinosa]